MNLRAVSGGGGAGDSFVGAPAVRRGGMGDGGGADAAVRRIGGDRTRLKWVGCVGGIVMMEGLLLEKCGALG
ncbi:MAG: hypothetical protein HC925_07230 [Coleofasciculaceae cyanobacterium SM2_3_26]|nr:hypothetical protein [Coleofasciculaceae cyanobacterium SM2_3_26]